LFRIYCCQNKEPVSMKMSKQVLMIVLILFIFIASGCSKNLFGPGNKETLLGEEEGAGAWDPKTQNGGNASSGLYEKPGSGQNFATAEQGTADNGATSAFGGDSFAENNDAGTSSGLYEKPGSGPDFGSASKGMPGDGASGSFSADSFAGNDSRAGTSSGFYEKPGPGPDFGSAPQGMPGDGASGSFSANSLDDNSGGSGDAAATPDSEFFREESVGEFDIASRTYEKPGPGPDFGSASQGMPGNGASGSFTAEPYVGQDESGQPPESAEPFLPGKGDNMALALPVDEEARRQLPYHESENLQDIHFEFDRFDLDNNSRAILKKNIAYLETHPNVRIEIQGHCDERGSNNYNITLGERRARSTKAFLISNGVDANRIHAISYGEERPFCFENNESCWRQNRRGHFLVAD
jgi:peptidoglycan-associated lipoprotein